MPIIQFVEWLFHSDQVFCYPQNKKVLFFHLPVDCKVPLLNKIYLNINIEIRKAKMTLANFKVKWFSI